MSTAPSQHQQAGARDRGELVESVVSALTGKGLTVATAESLTAGLVTARLADVPGASSCLLGGIVTYTTEQKTRVLDVPADLIETYTVVSGEVARAMAEGALGITGADLAVATTGAAGPADLEGSVPGTVYVAAVVAGGQALVRGCVGASRLRGHRGEVRDGTVDIALRLIEDVIPRSPVG